MKKMSDVRCKGRMPDTRRKCEKILYQSDGEFLFISGLVLNPDQNVQKIRCDNCGYLMIWKRNRDFIRYGCNTPSACCGFIMDE